MLPSLRRIASVPGLLATPFGRLQVRRGIFHQAWPFLSLLARWHRRTVAKRCTVIATIGSFGKTTTVRALDTALDLPLPVSGRNAWSSLALSVLRLRRNERLRVMEVGVNGIGQMSAYARMVRPDVVVVTSIGSEHNRSFVNLETTRHEKAEMVRALPEHGVVVGNGDDPNVRWMLDQTRARRVTFGWSPESDVWASDLRIDWPAGSQFLLHVGATTHAVRVRLLGRAMVNAVLAAVATLVALREPLEPALARLGRLEPTPGRLEPLRIAGGITILRDDFKSALETFDEALDLLAAVPAARRQVVLGDVSEPVGSQKPMYRRLGERVAGIADRAVFMGNSVRAYSTGAARGGLDRAQIVDGGRDAHSALLALQRDLRAGDVVLVKGRDTQRLDRITLALQGRHVGCHLDYCNAKPRCERCVALETGTDYEFRLDRAGQGAAR